jgi:hypothetical protein
LVILRAEEFVVKDRTETVSNLTVSPTGLSAGETVLFQGRIEADYMGVMIDPLPAGLTFEFSAESSPIATNRASTAILVGSPFDGNFIHAGSAMSSFSGITFAHTFSGTALNSGRVMADQIGVMFGAGTFSGEFTNTGNIKGGNEGVFVVGSFEGTVLNRGTIEGTQGYGIHLMHGNGGVVRNDGGRVVGEKSAIYPGSGDVKVVLSGVSQIVGGIDGGANTDTLRFENMRGISEEKHEELRALAESNPGAGSITLFGEVIEWRNFESIEADIKTLNSYETLISTPGLEGYARALDAAEDINEEFLEFMEALNEVDEVHLDAVTENTSGQTLLSGWDSFAREQDSRLFSFFGAQFSSLRGSVSVKWGRKRSQSRSVFIEAAGGRLIRG